MQQRGLATLWGATALLILTSLWGWFSLKAVGAESTRSAQQMQAAQALANAEALLETAVAQLEANYANPLSQADAQLWKFAAASSCPIDKPPPQWQCMRWPLSELPAPDGIDTTQSFVRLVRDVRQAPHLVQILVDAKLNASQAGVGSRATVQQSVYIPLSFRLPPLPVNDYFSSLVLNDSVISPASPLCDFSAWRSIFGEMTPTQLKTISDLQERNGLTDLTQPTRSVYWIDNPLLWTKRLGSLSAPVVLIFSEAACAIQCPAIASQITGTVFFQSQCQAHKIPSWQGGVIWGQLGMESNLTAAQKQAMLSSPNGLVPTHNAHDAFTFAWPEGIQASRVQRVAGTWKNAGY